MNLHVVNTVIHFSQCRARAYDTYMKKFFPYGIISVGEDRHENSAEYATYDTWGRALNAFMSELEYQEILDIEALMMLGRGDSDTFEKSLAYLVETYPNDDVESKGLAIDYIISKSPLDRYLSDGLDILNGTYERDSN